jgi:hypothetical protein
VSEYAVVQGLDPPSRRQQGELAEDNAPGASALRRRQIQNLTETYLTLSLGAICSHVGMDAAAEKDLFAERDEAEVQVLLTGQKNPELARLS